MGEQMFCVLLKSSGSDPNAHALELARAFSDAGAPCEVVEAPRVPRSDSMSEALAAGSQFAAFWERSVAEPAASGRIVVVADAPITSGPIAPELIRRICRIAMSSCPPQYSASVDEDQPPKKNKFDGGDATSRHAAMAKFAKECLDHHRRQSAIFGRRST